MRLAYQITGLILLPIAVFFGYQSLKLSYYTPLGPGPGFFPVWLCGLLALLAVLMILQASRGQDEATPPDFFADAAGYLRMAAAVVGLFATAALLPVLGFPITTFVFYVALLAVFGRRNPIEIIVLAAVGSLGVFYLFSRVLGQPLPAGLLDW